MVRGASYEGQSAAGPGDDINPKSGELVWFVHLQ